MNRNTLIAAIACAMIALVAAAPAASAATVEKEVFLHEPGTGYGDKYHISPEEIRVQKGDVVKLLVKVPDGQEEEHDLKIDGYGVQTSRLTAGQSEPLTFTADKAGEFEYYSTLPARKAGGERGLLIVEGAEGGEKGAPAPALVGVLAVLGLAAAGATRRRG